MNSIPLNLRQVLWQNAAILSRMQAAPWCLRDSTPAFEGFLGLKNLHVLSGAREGSGVSFKLCVWKLQDRPAAFYLLFPPPDLQDSVLPTRRA